MIGHEMRKRRNIVSDIALLINYFAHGIIIRTKNIELRGSV